MIPSQSKVGSLSYTDRLRLLSITIIVFCAIINTIINTIINIINIIIIIIIIALFTIVVFLTIVSSPASHRSQHRGLLHSMNQASAQIELTFGLKTSMCRSDVKDTMKMCQTLPTSPSKRDRAIIVISLEPFILGWPAASCEILKKFIGCCVSTAAGCSSGNGYEWPRTLWQAGMQRFLHAERRGLKV